MLEFQFRHVLCGALTGCSRFINAAEVTVYPRRSQHASPRSSRRALPRGNYMCVRVGMGDYSRFVVGDDAIPPAKRSCKYGRRTACTLCQSTNGWQGVCCSPYSTRLPPAQIPLLSRQLSASKHSVFAWASHYITHHINYSNKLLFVQFPTFLINLAHRNNHIQPNQQQPQ